MAVESSTPIPTADGWKRACDLSAKDVVFDQAGAPQPVLSVQSWIPLECYEVHMDDGLTVVGDRNLAFPCQTKNWREHFCRWFNRKSSRRPKEFRSAIWDGTVREILTRGLVDDRGKTNFSVGATGPVQFPTVDLPVPPYVFGLWLGTRTPPAGIGYAATWILTASGLGCVGWGLRWSPGNTKMVTPCLSLGRR